LRTIVFVALALALAACLPIGVRWQNHPNSAPASAAATAR
jgi:hypothetical protein